MKLLWSLFLVLGAVVYALSPDPYTHIAFAVVTIIGLVSIWVSRSEQPSQEAMVKKHRALIIDDDRLSAMMMEKSLKSISSNFEVQVCSEATEGLLVIKRSPPDVILLDMMMPNIRGDYVVRKLKRDNPDMLSKTIVYSSLSEEADLMKDVVENNVKRLSKPISDDMVRSHVLAVCPMQLKGSG